MGAYVSLFDLFALTFTKVHDQLTGINSGLGRHIDMVKDPEGVALRTSDLFTFFLQLAFTYSITLIKFAILAFYWRVFNTSSIRWPIIILAILSGVWLLARTFITIFHCVPVHAFWDKTVEDATCLISDSEYIFWSTLAHFVLDVVIIVLPVVEIRKLQQFSTKQKIGTCSLFGFGILVCAASLTVVVLAKEINSSSKDIPWNMANIMLWATVEVNLSVVSGVAVQSGREGYGLREQRTELQQAQEYAWVPLREQ
ncbi:L-fucose permease [Apiospora aurea]|uniref:L-fucose permease n=1 Tax=Apiospora aurea TaxID=335848 RepID=A0ABR1QVY9_9PEZI